MNAHRSRLEPSAQRDNLLRVVRFQRPDYIPMTFHINAASWFHYPHQALLDLMGTHPFLFRDAEAWKPPAREDLPRFTRTGERWTDPWGCTWETPMDGIIGTVTEHPLADWDRFESYEPPDPERTTHWGQIDWSAQPQNIGPAISQTCLPNGEIGHNHTWLKLTDTRGYENVLCDMADGDQRVHRLLDMLEQFNRGLVRNYIEHRNAEWIGFAEDLGLQQGPMLSPDQFREYIKPSYKRLMKAAHDAGCIVHVHADGDLRLLMDDLLDCPMDVINLQDRVNGIEWMKSNLAGKVCIDLDIDRQNVTVHGGPRQIDQMIREAVEALRSREGGLMMIYGMYPGTPLENAVAVANAMEKYAEFPQTRRGPRGTGRNDLISRSGSALAPVGLLCELLEQPERTRIMKRRPRFGWIMRDRAPDARQSACQILVASSLDALRAGAADMWDSGKIGAAADQERGSASVNVLYEGKPLESHATYHWQVRTWNHAGDVSAWSKVQTFRTGALQDGHVTAGYPLEQHAIEPVEVVERAPGHAFVDFGKAAFATLDLTLTCPQSDTVDVHLGEVRDATHAIHRSPGGSRRYRLIRLDVTKGTHTYRVIVPPDAGNTQARSILMPPSTGEVMPFRYAEVVGTHGPLPAQDIRQIAVTYRFNSEAARFSSSSRVLNDVWRLCYETMKATSFCGLYVDGDRERIPYEGDAYINQLGHYACDREFTLARRTCEYLITHPTWPTEWTLIFVLLAWADYEQTGDPSLLSHRYPDLQAKTLLALARPDGLISVEEHPPSPELLAALHCQHWATSWRMRDVVDWPEGERDHYDMVPVKTVVNAFHYRVLVLMGRIATVLGEGQDAIMYRERAVRVRKAMWSGMVAESRGLFVDGLNSAHCSLHANMIPLAFGLVPQSLRPSVLAFIKSKGMACSVYGAQFLLEGLYEAGEAEHGLSLLTSTGERSWAHMIYDVGTAITSEAWDDRFKPNQDWNHAWGAAPANIIPRYVMGVRALEPGFGRMLIHPQPGSLENAEMTVPTIRGPVDVRFHHDPGRSFHLDVDLPANTCARVILPRLDRSDATVRVDGQPIEAAVHGRVVVVDPVGSGRHRLRR